MSPSSCPICEGPLQPTGISAYDRLVTGRGPFTVLECRGCDYGVTDPQLRGEELASYYDPVGYDEEFLDHSGTQARGLLGRLRAAYRRRSSERRGRSRPFAVPGVEPGRVLDVGCGSGELLAGFAERGWETFGIDPSEAAVAAAAQRGAQTHHGTLGDQPWPEGSFRLVTMRHSLEHVPDPVEELRQVPRLLEPGGLLAIEVPNWSCWQRRRIFGNRWVALDLPRHQQHFSVTSLTRLAGELGLEVREAATKPSAGAPAYSLHFALFGHWSPGWKLWLSYGLVLPLLPLIELGNRRWGGDCCYAVLRKPA